MSVIVGRDIGNYVFNALAKTITFSGVPNLIIQDIDIITNQTDGVWIYNFASATLKGSLSGNVLTLDYDTTTMSDTDEIQIRLGQNYGIDYNLNAQLNIPQAVAPVRTSDYFPDVSSAQALTTAYTTVGSELDVTKVEEISFLIAATITATAVEFKIQAADVLGGTYGDVFPLNEIDVGTTSGTKEIRFDVRGLKYIRLQGKYTGTSASVTTKWATTLNS